MVRIRCNCDQKMNEKSLSPFQTWCLFLMFENHSQLFTSKDLLMKCCDSALVQLDPNKVHDELNYLSKEARLVSTSGGAYSISTMGIIWVRKNIANIVDACKNDKIKQDVIQQQDSGLITCLENKTLDLSKSIVHFAIKNIGPIISLMDSLS